MNIPWLSMASGVVISVVWQSLHSVCLECLAEAGLRGWVCVWEACLCFDSMFNTLGAWASFSSKQYTLCVMPKRNTTHSGPSSPLNESRSHLKISETTTHQLRSRNTPWQPCFFSCLGNDEESEYSGQSITEEENSEDETTRSALATVTTEALAENVNSTHTNDTSNQVEFILMVAIDQCLSY